MTPDVPTPAPDSGSDSANERELSPGQFAEAKAAFLAVSEMGLADCEEYLERELGEKPEVRAMVRRLLDVAAKPLPYETLADDLLVAHLQAQREKAPSDSETGGSHIGPYRLLERLGEGGFGVVYLAEQREPIRRQVALKVIKLGMDTQQVVARFEAERQAMAMMSHPGIAQVFDAGTTATGRPYFVMELVHGESITSYCDNHNLSIPGRLELFAKVCAALHHAHQKGIIHRDIKPSNVLVTSGDGEPTPKVIDFGIAKATSVRLSEETVYTEFRQMIGTPEYMSPEQAKTSSASLDSRTDVYSLGVLLYELLTGSPPFDSARLRSAAYAEMQRIIRDEDPQRPSTRLSATGTISSVATRRAVDPGRLSSILAGDLDWVVMRCLEKDPERRYDSAAEIGREIRRFLAGSPVEAVPPSRAYLARKILGRHRKAAGAAAALVLLLLLGIFGTSLGLVRARVQERLAEQNAELADRQNYVAQIQLAWSGLGEGPGRVGEILNRAPIAYRGWEWHAIHARLDLSSRTVKMPWPDDSLVYPESTSAQILPHPDEQSVFLVTPNFATNVEHRDLESGELRWAVSASDAGVTGAKSSWIDVSRSGDRLFVSSLHDQQEAFGGSNLSRHVVIRALQTSDGSLLQEFTVPIPADAMGVEVDSIHARVYCVLPGNLVCALDTRAGRVVAEQQGLPWRAARLFPSEDGRFLLISSGRGDAAILNASDLSLVARLDGHTNVVRSVGISGDGLRMITGSMDGTARVWNLADRAEPARVLSLGTPLDRVWLNHEGTIAITETDAIRSWDLETGLVIGTFASEGKVGGSSFVLPESGMFGCRQPDGSTKLWYPDAVQTVTLTGHAGHVNAARFTGPTGYIVSVGWDGWAAGEPGCIRVWDADTGLAVAALGEPGEVGRSLDISHDGRYAIVGVTHGRVRGIRIIDLIEGSTRSAAEIDIDMGIQVAAHPTEPIVAVHLEDSLRLIDLESGENLVSSVLQLKSVEHMFWLPDASRIIAVAGPGTLDTTARVASFDGKDLRLLETASGSAVALAPDGKGIIAYEPESASLSFLEPSTLEVIRREVLVGIGPGSVKLSASQTRIAASSPEDQAVMLWDAETLDRVAVFSGDGYVSDLSWNRDGTRLLATFDETIQLWGTQSPGDRARRRHELTQATEALQRATSAAAPSAHSMIRANVIQSLQTGFR